VKQSAAFCQRKLTMINRFPGDSQYISFGMPDAMTAMPNWSRAVPDATPFAPAHVPVAQPNAPCGAELRPKAIALATSGKQNAPEKLPTPGRSGNSRRQSR
jgi:hypothetical protein